ncbi:transcriptional regulator, AraC family [Fodinibius roseus]|uniref:Transcriptional regulator, AraC family n=1 Tax=Fodinibius roseus TaxID=1194090 RepID=A0A1M5ER62_9BACT|nr:AraC family transcriptional regulator [Fodinibius roseus]SHF81624.1 transcriptional regulator, AraC family [Fodinibius roseus]
MDNPENSQTHTDYISRINKVFDYIEDNIDKDLSLDELAAESHFSKYHFSRIFDAMVGETPFEFIKRVRLEKAATRLRLYPDETVTKIAFECGFNDLAVFSRNFRDFFGKSPTEWQDGNPEKSNHSQTFDSSDLYLDTERNRNHNMEALQSAQVRDLSDQTVAYIRHTGPYKGDEALFNRLFGRLFSWAGPRGLTGQRNADPLVIYHDDPCVTDPEKLRMSVCLPVPPDTTVDGEIGKMERSGGRFLVARFVIAPQDMPKAWEWIYGSWFPSSGYQPADVVPFEVYPEPPENGKLTVEICVPVKPL